MKRKLKIISTLFLSITMFGMNGASLGSDSDYIDDNKPGFFSSIRGGGKEPGVAPVENQLYLEECGSCHFPYQPGLLPARSWIKVMAGLEDHFDENAELLEEDAKILTDYLMKNAADDAHYKRSKKIMSSLRSSEAPIRVSKTPYFINKHNELTRNMVQENPKVGSYSKCQACHTKADSGSFSESEILIPGFGAWED